MRLSIIVPTHNRAHRVTDCLDAIRCAAIYAQNVDLELIVVDNNSGDDTQCVLKEWAQGLTFPFHILLQEKKGVNAARNMALRHASGDVLILIDDDCFVQEDYFQRIHDLYEQDDQPLLRFSKINFANDDDWPMTIKTSPYFQRWHKNSQDAFRIGEIIGCSMIFTRDIYQKVGLYDEMFSTSFVPGGNDTEFCIRIYNAGFEVQYVPELILSHAHGRNNQESVEKLIKKYCIGGGACYAKFLLEHPHIRNRRFKKLQPRYPAIPTEYQDERNKIIASLYYKNRKYVYLGMVRYYVVKIYNFFTRKWQEK